LSNKIESAKKNQNETRPIESTPLPHFLFFSARLAIDYKKNLWPCLVYPKIKNFLSFLSYRILWYMYESLNINENKN